jgi:hypothetical protein
MRGFAPIFVLLIVLLFALGRGVYYEMQQKAQSSVSDLNHIGPLTDLNGSVPDAITLSVGQKATFKDSNGSTA